MFLPIRSIAASVRPLLFSTLDFPLHIPQRFGHRVGQIGMIQIVVHPHAVLYHNPSGTPTTVELGGTSRRTTEPAPIFELSDPKRAQHFRAAGNQHLFPMVGCRFPFSLPVPPKVTP